MEPEYKDWNDIEKLNWRYAHKELPVGQKWGDSDGLITNGRGEGFSIHRGMKQEEKRKLINALNKRDFEIVRLTNEIERLNRIIDTAGIA